MVIRLLYVLIIIALYTAKDAIVSITNHPEWHASAAPRPPPALHFHRHERKRLPAVRDPPRWPDTTVGLVAQAVHLRITNPPGRLPIRGGFELPRKFLEF